MKTPHQHSTNQLKANKASSRQGKPVNVSSIQINSRQLTSKQLKTIQVTAPHYTTINRLILDTGRIAWIVQELGYTDSKTIADYYEKGFGEAISPNTLNIVLEKLKNQNHISISFGTNFMPYYLPKKAMFRTIENMQLRDLVNSPKDIKRKVDKYIAENSDIFNE